MELISSSLVAQKIRTAGGKSKLFLETIFSSLIILEVGIPASPKVVPQSCLSRAEQEEKKFGLV